MSAGLTHTDIDLRKTPSMYCPLRRDLSCGHLALNPQAHLLDGPYTLCRGHNVNAHWIDRLSTPLCSLLLCTFYNYARCSSDDICGTILIFLILLSSCRKRGYYSVDTEQLGTNRVCHIGHFAYRLEVFTSRG